MKQGQNLIRRSKRKSGCITVKLSDVISHIIDSKSYGNLSKAIFQTNQVKDDFQEKTLSQIFSGDHYQDVKSSTDYIELYT